MKPVWRSDARALRGAACRARGFTLIDVLVIVVLLGTVAGTMTTLFSRLAAESAQALREREMQAFARSLLDEVLMMPMTYCDPQDTRAALATRAALGGSGCATSVEALGPEPGETRYGPSRFDNVSDYQGFTMPGPGCAGLCDIGGNRLDVAGSSWVGCSAAVTMAPQALPGIAALDADARPQALRVVVQLRCPGRADALAEGVRVRHAPNAR